MKAIFALGLLFEVSCSPAVALTNKELVGFCNSPKDSSNYLSCRAYLHGVYDGLTMASASADFRFGFCPPDKGLSLDEVQDAALGYIKLHPTIINDDAALASSMFLLEVYACKKDK